MNRFEDKKSKLHEKERAILVGVRKQGVKDWEVEDFLGELKALAHTAGTEVVGQIQQSLDTPSPSTYIGAGKVEQLRALVLEKNAQIVIFDDDLTPAQNRNLENSIKTKVLDRTGLILDIFAQRARSKEGKLQVELAQLNYLLTRLVRRWTHLSRQYGTIGVRGGPGETQLEVDRRRVRERITVVKERLSKVHQSRELHRLKRRSVPVPTATLIGYTNAGKSTLFNALAKADTLVEDKLFATLDPLTKRVRLPNGQLVLISDTVGFIRKLPHQLVESFKATFEEIRDADLLIHVIDISHPHFEEHVKAVEHVLREVSLDKKPIMPVFNKTDLAHGIPSYGGARNGDIPVSKVSGLTGDGLDEFLVNLEKFFSRQLSFLQISLPITAGKQIFEIYKKGHVVERKDYFDRVVLRAYVPKKLAEKLKGEVKELEAKKEAG
jgi:GTP-binding protein HflX